MATVPALEMPAATIRLRKAAELMGVTHQSANRYVLSGARGRDGQRHKLRSIRIGGSYRTTVDWVNEFIAALNTEPPTAGPVASLNTEPPTAGPAASLIQFLDREAEAVRAALGA